MERRREHQRKMGRMICQNHETEIELTHFYFCLCPNTHNSSLVSIGHWLHDFQDRYQNP
jgi:hypothetical protein